MNILVTLNSNYVPPLTVMLHSLMRSGPQSKFDLYIAHSSLTQADLKAIGNACDEKRTQIHTITVPSELLADAPVLKRLSKETYYRLLAAELLPRHVKRVLYIDPDTVILNDLEPFYHTPLNGCLMAASGHTSGWIEALNHLRLHMKKGTRYINAGIILMDLQAMRCNGTVQDIFDYIRKNKKKLYLGDQDVINGFFNGKIKIMDELLYNLDEKTYARHRKEIDLKWVEAHTVIVHYNGQYKPWKADYKGVLQGFYEANRKELSSGVLPQRKGSMIA